MRRMQARGKTEPEGLISDTVHWKVVKYRARSRVLSFDKVRVDIRVCGILA